MDGEDEEEMGKVLEKNEEKKPIKRLSAEEMFNNTVKNYNETLRNLSKN